MLMEVTRGGRGVVLSSGSDEIITIRAPFDVSNLCTLFGVDSRHGRKFVAGNFYNCNLGIKFRKIYFDFKRKKLFIIFKNNFVIFL